MGFILTDVRYDQAWRLAAAMPDLYGLATACVAARSIPITLQDLQEHVICPIWQAFGCMVDPYLQDATFHDLADMHLQYARQMQDAKLERAYLLLMHICCSESCADDIRYLLCAAVIPQAPCQLLAPLAANAPQLPEYLRGLVKHIELCTVQSMFATPRHASCQGFSYQVTWCAGCMPRSTMLRRLNGLGIQLDPYPIVIAHRRCGCPRCFTGLLFSYSGPES